MLGKVELASRPGARLAGPSGPRARPMGPGLGASGPVRDRLPMMTSGLATNAAVTALSTFGPAPASNAALGPTPQEPGEQEGLGVPGPQQEAQGQQEEERRQGLADMWQQWNSYFPVCIGGAAALAIGVLMLLAFMPKATISCFYDITTLGTKADDFAWIGSKICHDVHVRLPLLPGGEVTRDYSYWNLKHPEDKIYMMYLWDEVREHKENFKDLKGRFDNKKRRYSLGWLNMKHLPTLASLQAFVDVFKSGSTAEDSGIGLGLILNEDQIQNSRETLVSVVGGVSPKFTVLLTQLEDTGLKACQIFPYWRNNKIYELLKVKGWPAPVALPVSAAVYRATKIEGGGFCISFKQADRTEQNECPKPTEDNVFITLEGRQFGAESRKSLEKLKQQYHEWRVANICALNMEYFFFFHNCVERNTTDFIL